MKKVLLISLVLMLIFVTSAFARTKLVKKDITAENQFTESLSLTFRGVLVIDDTSAMNMTVTLQVRAESSADWVDTDTQTAAGGWPIVNPSGGEYRVGVKTGDFTSGTATVYIRGE